MSRENINYLYLGYSILFLIGTFYYLEYTKKDIVKTKYLQNNKTLCCEDDIYTNDDLFELHLKKIKDKLMKLSKYYDKNNCECLKVHIKNADKSLKKYINLNRLDINDGIYNPSFSLNQEIIKERKILKNKLDSKQTRSDKDDAQDEMIKLLLNIDIILLLSKSSVCKKGKLDLSSLNAIITELSHNKRFKNADLNKKEGFCGSYDPENKKYNPNYEESEYAEYSAKDRFNIKKKVVDDIYITEPPNYAWSYDDHDSVFETYKKNISIKSSVNKSEKNRDFVNSEELSNDLISPIKDITKPNTQKALMNNLTYYSHSSDNVGDKCFIPSLGKQLKNTNSGRLDWYTRKETPYIE